MVTLFTAILLLGVISGLRAFTAPAVLRYFHGGGIWAVVLAIAAVLEYAGDVYPKTPPRTQWPSLIVRLLSAGYCGWQLAATNGASVAAGVLLACIGAVAGAYGGVALRERVSAKIGNVPAGLIESALALVAAILIVTRM
ncbi:MAG: hypothetical protein JO199_05565 [Candidatus Eremiobacteraeota bacterium]|nr:hypothetical protein [Candidatus Eremiobacteraeota bacterium]